MLRFAPPRTLPRPGPLSNHSWAGQPTFFPSSLPIATVVTLEGTHSCVGPRRVWASTDRDPGRQTGQGPLHGAVQHPEAGRAPPGPPQQPPPALPAPLRFGGRVTWPARHGLQAPGSSSGPRGGRTDKPTDAPPASTRPGIARGGPGLPGPGWRLAAGHGRAGSSRAQACRGAAAGTRGQRRAGVLPGGRRRVPAGPVTPRPMRPSARCGPAPSPPPPLPPHKDAARACTRGCLRLAGPNRSPSPGQRRRRRRPHAGGPGMEKRVVAGPEGAPGPRAQLAVVCLGEWAAWAGRGPGLPFSPRRLLARRLLPPEARAFRRPPRDRSRTGAADWAVSLALPPTRVFGLLG